MPAAFALRLGFIVVADVVGGREAAADAQLALAEYMRQMRVVDDPRGQWPAGLVPRLPLLRVLFDPLPALRRGLEHTCGMLRKHLHGKKEQDDD